MLFIQHITKLTSKHSRKSTPCMTNEVASPNDDCKFAMINYHLLEQLKKEYFTTQHNVMHHVWLHETMLKQSQTPIVRYNNSEIYLFIYFG